MADQSLHFRRCHVCGAVTERKDTIEKCGGCGKAISPFFYFDDRTILVGETGGALTLGQSSALPVSKDAKPVRPVIGLSAYWPAQETQARGRSPR